MENRNIKTICVMVLMSMLLISVFAHPVAAFADPLRDEYEERDLNEVHGKPIVIDLDIGEKSNNVATISIPSVDFQYARAGPIEIDPDLLEDPKSFEGAIINLNLFIDTSFTSCVSNITEHTDGGISIRLTLEGFDIAFSILSIENNIANGIIEIPEELRTYVIRWDSNSELHFVYETEFSNNDVINENVFEENIGISKMELTDHELMYNPNQHVTVDIMVLYTPAARASVGGDNHGNILTMINTAVGTANVVFSNSKTYCSLNVVHRGEVSYTESGSLSDDRITLRDRTDVQQLRNQKAADLVIFITLLTLNQIENGPWGTAAPLSRLNDGGGEPHLAHTAVVGLQFLVNPVSLYVFTHEVGHLFGCSHHRNDPQPGPRSWYDWPENDWTAGYHFSVLGVGYQTVMCRNSFTRAYLPYFSTPNVKTFGIFPVGNDLCNNARTIHTTKHIVSSYRNNLGIWQNGCGDITRITPRLAWNADRGRHVYARGEVTLKATSWHPHYRFNHWSEGWNGPVISYLSEITIFVEKDRAVTAHWYYHPYAGCPYVSVWNGTDYQHDNNILIASEHQEGVVDDNYILRNTMVPKDGFYSLKIEEFEYTEDFFDTFSLYTMDHREGYSVGTTPDGEYRTFKEPVPPESTYDCAGNDVLEYVSAPDGNSLFMEENTTIVLNYGDIGNARWWHQKLVVRSYGFESYTEPSTQGLDMDAGLGGISPMFGGWGPPAQKTSLYISIRADGSDWTNVTVLHPRNHPSDMVIPLGDVLQQFVPGGIGELEVKILSTQNHSVDFVGLDNSVPTTVRVQKASMVSAMLNGVEDVTDILLEGNDEMVSIIPGEYIILTFEIPRQRPGRAFAVRDYMLFSRGYYQLYEGGNTTCNSAETIQGDADKLIRNGGQEPRFSLSLKVSGEKFYMR